MNPRITSIENLIASDPGERNIFGLVVADQLRFAAQSLRLAKRVAIVSGFFIPEAGAGETDGPPGAKVLGQALMLLGIDVDYITDAPNAALFSALDITPTVVGPDPPSHVGQTFQSVSAVEFLDLKQPTHLVSIERVGRAHDGRYRNMRGIDITDVTAPLDDLFLEGTRRGLTTIGIGDGGNEIGMGKVFADTFANIEHGRTIATTVATDFCIAAGVSNWGAYGLAGALSVLEDRDLLPSAESVARDLGRIVDQGGAVDGVTHRHEPTTDGLDLSASLHMLESIRHQLAASPFVCSGRPPWQPSPYERSEPSTVRPGKARPQSHCDSPRIDRGSLLVGVLGYGEAGRAAAALLTRHGHRICISDVGAVTLDPGTVTAGVEAGGHSIAFLGNCDLVVASPGVRADSPIFNALHRRGIPVMSELELAYQLGPPPPGDGLQPARTPPAQPSQATLIAVTGTIGKRTTVELLQQLFRSAGQPLTIGGNRGRPLSELLLDHNPADAIAVAVSSFQLETVVHFRPDIAILLNIDEAHLDRHRSIAEYVRIKSRIFMNHRPDDALILPFDDQRLRVLARKHQGRTFFVSTLQAVDRGAWLGDGVLRINVDGTVETIAAANPLFPENLLAAVLTARLCGISTERIARAAQQLPAPSREPQPSPRPMVPPAQRTANYDTRGQPRGLKPTAPYARMTGKQIRTMCRAGEFTGPTSGVAMGFAQANLVVLRTDMAGSFTAFCQRNPKPCPVLEITQPGRYEPASLAIGADIRTDLPGYRVYRNGDCVDKPTSIEPYWDDDCVAFLIGCSFTFEDALLEAGIGVRHIEQGCNVPMYRTNIACKPSGPFSGPLIVSMRPMTPAQAETAKRVTAAYPSVHGEPVHIGDPGAIGISDLGSPDYGDAVTIRAGEIPVFWACGVTPMEAVMQAKPDLAITHEPGHMFVTDTLDHSLRRSTKRA